MAGQLSIDGNQAELDNRVKSSWRQMLSADKLIRFSSGGSKKANQAAFTLVELIAISLVVASMLLLVLPTLARAKQRTTEANCQSNLRQIGLAVQAYAADHDGFLPGPVLGLANPRYDLWSTNQLAWFLAAQMGSGRPSVTAKVAPLLLCPAQGPGQNQPLAKGRANYVLNDGYRGENGLIEAPFGRSTPPLAQPLELTRLAASVSPATSLAMADADKADVNPTLPGWNDLPYQPVHGKIRNQLFFDWHVARKSW